MSNFYPFLSSHPSETTYIPNLTPLLDVILILLIFSLLLLSQRNVEKTGLPITGTNVNALPKKNANSSDIHITLLDKQRILFNKKKISFTKFQEILKNRSKNNTTLWIHISEQLPIKHIVNFINSMENDTLGEIKPILIPMQRS